jgi:hypothetical protein
MKFRNGIIALGFLIVALQFMGFPQSWKKATCVGIGVAFMVLGYIGGRPQKSPTV